MSLYNGRQIYEAGTRLADVPLDFRGQPWAVWARQLEIEAQERWKHSHRGPAALLSQRVAGPRDRYGIKGIAAHSAPLLGKGA